MNLRKREDMFNEIPTSFFSNERIVNKRTLVNEISEKPKCKAIIALDWPQTTAPAPSKP